MSLPRSFAARITESLPCAIAVVVLSLISRPLLESHSRVSLPEQGANRRANPAPTAAPTTTAVRMPLPLLRLLSLKIASLSVDELDFDSPRPRLELGKGL